MQATRLTWVLIAGALAAPAVADSRSAPVSACGYLSHSMAQQPTGAVLLASYPTVRSGPLAGTAFVYDNAVAAIALAACGQVPLARRIGDALLLAMDHDRYWHDGRLRNAYAAGAVTNGATVKLSGWWDASAGKWLEDRYQVGSDTGNMAWAMLVMLTLEADTREPRYRDGALRLARWAEQRADARGAGGFTGGDFGHEPAPQVLQWKSSEHNTDLAAAFGWLAQVTGDAHWQQRSIEARQFVDAMWRADGGYFAVGTGEDGVTLNPLLTLDAQVWPLLALPAAVRRHQPVLASIDRRLRFENGYTYSEAGGGSWSEGTAQVAVVLELLHRDGASRAVQASLQAQRAQDGGYYASDVPASPTGFMLATDPTKPRVYFHLEHLGATAWAALAEQRFNPFTGRSGLPQ